MKLTLPQQDIYFEQLMFPEDPIYNIGAKIVINGTIVYNTLNDAYLALINQHDTYRSSISLSDDEVTMKTSEKYISPLEFVDFSSLQNADIEANDFMQKRFETPFEFTSDNVLHKFILIKVRENLHYLFSVYHHIITDGWGTSLMFQRLVKNYNELSEFGEISTDYPFTYKDFVQDDEQYSLSESYQNDKRFWTTKFQQLPERLFEKINQNDKTNQSKRKEIIIKRSVYNVVEEIATDLGATTFHVILGILYLYFGRKHHNKDFAIGLPVLNRGKSIYKKTVGLFMGISPLRIQFNQDDSFEDLVKTIKQQLRQDYRHQRFPLGKLIKELDLFHEKDRLFNITLSYEKQNYADHFHDTQTTVIPLSHHSERVALAIYIREFDALEDVKIDFDYNVNYFDETAINKVTAHFEKLLSEIIANPKELISNYEYITTAERQMLLYDFNKTQFNYPQNATVVDLFKEQVLHKPNSIAIVDEEIFYTYHDLDVLSNKIAFYLQKRTEQSDKVPIAVLMNRSANLVAVLLGILKSGNAYIPLDPAFPKDRLEYIIEHSEVKQVISTHDLKKDLNLENEIIDIDLIINEESILDSVEVDEAFAASVAYIIYTSGSTGNPKGVAISHKALLNFLISIKHEPKIKHKDYLFSVTTQSFDISILEFFAPLISGAKLYVASQELLSDPLEVVLKIKEIKPTIIQATPSFFQMLYNAGWKGNKNIKILCGGDLLSETLAEKLLETNGELWNMYGPTETTIWSSCKKILQANEASNIGKPIHNTQIYILDECMQLLPVDSVGAIYIGGDGLAAGYFKNEELTNEKFIKSTIDLTRRIYNTGDLGKWNEKGEIEFLGRNDNQVKIRGYRIELGEIETILNTIQSVKAAVVVAQKSEEQQAILIAYLITEKETFNSNLIIESLREVLPEYMIPHAIIPLDEFPLTPNKKVDRKALSSIKLASEKLGVNHKDPTTEIEIALCKYYKELLPRGIEFGVTDNFFVLGGHSLIAVKLINRINKKLHYRITLKDIFDYPTIETLSKYLEKKEKKENTKIIAVEDLQYYNVTQSQYGIWLASQQEEKSIAYNMPALFRINGELNKQVLEQVFLKLQKKYEILRTNFIEIGGIPYQQIFSQEERPVLIEEFNFEGENVTNVINHYINKSFELNKEPLLKVGLFHQNEGNNYLVFCTHHIIMDGWSLEILINEFVSKYKQIANKEDSNDVRLEFQFRDYAVWYEKEQKINHEKNLKFWETYLHEYTWENSIPVDKDLYEEEHACKLQFIYKTLTFDAINKFIQKKNISLHTLLTGAYSMLLYIMYGKEDFCLGTVNSGRTHAELQNQLGMFVKTLPLRNKINSEHTFEEVLLKTQQNSLLIDEHQDVPQIIQNTFRLDTLLVLQNQSFTYENIAVNESLELQLKDISTNYNRLPLLITFGIDNGNLSGTIDYNTSNYQKETIELIQLKYEKLLLAIIETPNKSLNTADLELDFEKEKIIDIDFNF
ncbi:non-ribosomal peptide synthetase [Flavobacterium branchiicola]|uniref:Non-ribosomal peptide synthetase n=1 Tax=Flavobacterium branchiicola TaxID=1114875 RepID=A0ABV9PHS4_9FLAO|nr:non-ribosomal peptide synthetase [Flavobacterium branchiicola]MBS7256350.1 amino acid adenylation domain-containing protein [Flavobacterium branchiicola]